MRPYRFAFETCHVCVFLFRYVRKQATVTEPNFPPLEFEAEKMDFFNNSQQANKFISRHGNVLGGMTFIST